MNLRRILTIGVLTAIAGGLLRRYGPVRRFEIAETSMAPSLRPGDYVLTLRKGALRRGAQVIYEHPMRPEFFLTKRVVGLPGEQVTIREGLVLIDGMPLVEPWAHDHEGPDGEWDVPRDAVFVLGDDRRCSQDDSRYVGAVPLNRLDFVLGRYWPLSRANA
ncbi:MAG: signal peptidase I [Acidimicrobiia bacterium]